MMGTATQLGLDVGRGVCLPRLTQTSGWPHCPAGGLHTCFLNFGKGGRRGHMCLDFWVVDSTAHQSGLCQTNEAKLPPLPCGRRHFSQATVYGDISLLGHTASHFPRLQLRELCPPLRIPIKQASSLMCGLCSSCKDETSPPCTGPLEGEAPLRRAPTKCLCMDSRPSAPWQDARGRVSAHWAKGCMAIDS